MSRSLATPLHSSLVTPTTTRLRSTPQPPPPRRRRFRQPRSLAKPLSTPLHASLVACLHPGRGGPCD